MLIWFRCRHLKQKLVADERPDEKKIDKCKRTVYSNRYVSVQCSLIALLSKEILCREIKPKTMKK